ncbi:T9SS type A sorting domain-containing protein [Aquimarina sp. ERC-38]|uniref:hypothetical protein n=1 Tax=Aquimarina sp. ERC-38 TaxID=2949996 RepID=UPI002245B8ED|nr:hypothetical protein [Aquimarina sp. ERC-38]UZO81357.1 T9SS type A sorting domain-containing protein [Aquimarina sp. ERC-38]
MNKKQFILTILGISLSAFTYGQGGIQIFAFKYDEAGNEINFQIPIPPSFGVASKDELESIEKLTKENLLDDQFSVSPNPTSGEVTLQWNPDLHRDITAIRLVSLVNSESQAINFNTASSVSIDLSGKATGLYLVIFHLKGGSTPFVQKKVIKH